MNWILIETVYTLKYHTYDNNLNWNDLAFHSLSYYLTTYFLYSTKNKYNLCESKFLIIYKTLDDFLFGPVRGRRGYVCDEF